MMALCRWGPDLLYFVSLRFWVELFERDGEGCGNHHYSSGAKGQKILQHDDRKREVCCSWSWRPEQDEKD